MNNAYEWAMRAALLLVIWLEAGAAQAQSPVSAEDDESMDTLVVVGTPTDIETDPAEAVATRLYGTWVENDQELPGALTRAQLDADPDQANIAAVGGDYQLDVETWRLASKTTWQIDAERRLDAGFSVEEQDLFHPIVDRVLVDFDGLGPAPPVEVFSLLIDTDHRDVGAMLRYQHAVGRHHLLAGVTFGRNDVEGGNYRNLGGMHNGLTTVVDNDATSLEVFAMDRWRMSDRLTVVAAAQGVSASREARNRDVASGMVSNPADDYSSINPRLGVLLDLRDDVTVYGNISRLYEPPTNFELQDNVLGGNATLDAMHGSVIEAGLRGDREIGSGSRWGWDVAVYYAAIEDEILSVEDPDAPGTSLVTNVDDTVHAGVEALVEGSFGIGSDGGHYLEPVIALTLNEFNFDDDPIYADNRLPAAPEYAIRGEVIYRNAGGFFLGPTFDLVGRRYADSQTCIVSTITPSSGCEADGRMIAGAFTSTSRTSSTRPMSPTTAFATWPWRATPFSIPARRSPCSSACGDGSTEGPQACAARASRN